MGSIAKIEYMDWKSKCLFDNKAKIISHLKKSKYQTDLFVNKIINIKFILALPTELNDQQSSISNTELFSKLSLKFQPGMKTCPPPCKTSIFGTKLFSTEKLVLNNGYWITWSRDWLIPSHHMIGYMFSWPVFHIKTCKC